jgi:hypothetical protein
MGLNKNDFRLPRTAQIHGSHVIWLATRTQLQNTQKARDEAASKFVLEWRRCYCGCCLRHYSQSIGSQPYAARIDVMSFL